jgi:hypothetical protein
MPTDASSFQRMPLVFRDMTRDTILFLPTNKAGASLRPSLSSLPLSPVSALCACACVHARAELRRVRVIHVSHYSAASATAGGVGALKSLMHAQRGLRMRIKSLTNAHKEPYYSAASAAGLAP